MSLIDLDVLKQFLPVLLAQWAILSTGAATPSGSLFRYAAVMLEFAVSWRVAASAYNSAHNNGQASLFCATVFGHACTCAERLLGSKWTWEAYGPTNINNTKRRRKSKVVVNVPVRSTRDTLLFPFKLNLDTRGAGELWEVKNVPQWSSSGVPSRSRFLLWSMIALLSSAAILTALGMQPPAPEGIFASEKVPLFNRLNEIDAEELIVRIMSTIFYWTGAFCSISMIWSFAAIVAVGTGLSEPAKWRPLANFPFEMYTIRQFWG
jgi:hypothetical protein